MTSKIEKIVIVFQDGRLPGQMIIKVFYSREVEMMEGKIRSISEAVSFAMNGDNDGYNYLYEKTWKNKYYVALKYMKNEDLYHNS